MHDMLACATFEITHPFMLMLLSYYWRSPLNIHPLIAMCINCLTSYNCDTAYRPIGDVLIIGAMSTHTASRLGFWLWWLLALSSVCNLLDIGYDCDLPYSYMHQHIDVLGYDCDLLCSQFFAIINLLNMLLLLHVTLMQCCC